MDELHCGQDFAPFEYAVLNACRAPLFAVDGTLRSKLNGADRYLAQHPGNVPVCAALARRRGTDSRCVDSAGLAEPSAEAVARVVRAAVDAVTGL